MILRGLWTAADFSTDRGARCPPTIHNVILYRSTGRRRTVSSGMRRGAVGWMVADVSHLGGFDSTCGGRPTGMAACSVG